MAQLYSFIVSMKADRSIQYYESKGITLDTILSNTEGLSKIATSQLNKVFSYTDAVDPTPAPNMPSRKVPTPYTYMEQTVVTFYQNTCNKEGQ